MTSKHTPGPWMIKNGHEFQTKSGHTLWSGNVGVNHAEFAHIQSSDHCLPTYGISREETKANAVLIAAAPNMLAALNAFLDQWSACGPNSNFGRHFRSVRDAALEAIAAADPTSKWGRFWLEVVRPAYAEVTPRTHWETQDKVEQAMHAEEEGRS